MSTKVQDEKKLVQFLHRFKTRGVKRNFVLKGERGSVDSRMNQIEQHGERGKIGGGSKRLEDMGLFW